ncbi:hypothetical protein KBD20_00960 [Candidatus Saccharibacteria bacterium]|nr:hypothetical protein [Candidatus Saccharibacteria bacterium]
MNEGDGENQFTYTPTGVAAPSPQNPTEQDSGPVTPPTETIQWQASEFVDHEKNNSWFVILAVGAFFMCGLVYLITRSVFSTFVVLVAVLAFGVTAKQKPRTMQYSLLPTGIQVGDKRYRYNDFRSFSLTREGALWSISLIPIKRFMPLLTIYFDPNDGEKIFDVLASQMPHEERKLDTVDQLMKRIRF